MNLKTILAVAAPFVAIGAVFLAYFLAKKSRREERFTRACEDFISAFEDEFRQLRFGAEDPHIILASASDKHISAVMRFKRFLKGRQLSAFDKAWREYYYYEDSNMAGLERYSAKGVGYEEKKKRRELALERISRLISFAKPK
jgi:hypothetical protein